MPENSTGQILDGLWRLADNGGCAGVVRTCHWHQRSIAEVSARYDAGVWARRRDRLVFAPSSAP